MKHLRQHLAELLDSNAAHATFDQIIAGIPPGLYGKRAKGTPHTLWQLLEHLRIAQWDILAFSRNPRHVSPDFPAGYWPRSAAPPSQAAWEKSVRAFRRDLKAMRKLVSDPKTDLFRPIAHGTGETVLREALLVADHNAYHLAQMVLVRRLLGAWPGQ